MTTEQVRITELQVEDFKKITFVKFPVKPGVNELSGQNGAGKSSAIDAVAVWLDGLKVAPAEPIRSGAQRSRIRGRLGEMYVTRTIAKSKGGAYTTEIRFEPVGGKPYPATQRQLTDLIGEHNLDPLDFINLDTKGKFNALKAFVHGFNFEKAAQDHAADFTRRTDVNRLLRESRAAADLIAVPKDTPAEPIDEAALVQALQAAGVRNTELEARKARRAEAIRQITAQRAQALQFTDAVAAVRPERLLRHDQFKAQQQARIDDLKAQIAALEYTVKTDADSAEDDISAKQTHFTQQASAATEQADSLQKRLDEAGELPEPVDTDALTAQITAARAINANVTRAAERHRHANTAAKYEAESEALTDAMAAREQAKQKAISESKLPIAGIEFGDGEIRYEGAPFEQASTAQKLKVAMARIVALNPKLRFAWIRDASLLDDESYAELQRLAAEYEVDILIETVRPIGKDAVVLENGFVKGAEKETAV